MSADPLSQLQELIGPVYETDEPDFLQRFPDDTFGWDGDNPFIKQIVHRVAPRLIVEVGTWKGQSAFTMIDQCLEDGYDTQLICVDTWLGATEHWFDHRWQLNLQNGSPQLYETFLANVIRRNHERRITPFRATASIAAEVFARLGLRPDLVYLDASHLERDVYTDLTCYHPLVRGHGVLFGHDYGAHAPGVIAAVDRFAAEHGLAKTIQGVFYTLS